MTLLRSQVEAEEPPMKIALAVEGSRGDVYPMLELGASFAAAGHRIAICANPDFRASAEERGFEFRPLGNNIREFLTSRAGAITGGALKLMRELDRYSRENLILQFDTLSEITRDVDLLFGGGVLVAGPTAAERNGIPYRYVAYCPVIFPSREYTPCFFLKSQFRSRWANGCWWRIVGALVNAMNLPGINRRRAELGLRPVRDAFQHMVSERPILAADAELAPCPADAPAQIEQIPCLHPFEGEPLPAKLEAFLASGPPPVYLGFGSMPDPDPGATTGKLLDAVQALGCRALVSRGWAGLGEGPLPEGVFALEEISHMALFPRVAAVVHHGGAGTTTTAARAGVPQILVPHLLDQYYWARRVRELGLGPPPILRTRLTPGRLTASLAATLDNEVLSERARELGTRLRAAARRGADRTHLLEPPSRDQEPDRRVRSTWS
jgi:UDP:flavonoid glycosyltransferase YjiC (YdhE family)